MEQDRESREATTRENEKRASYKPPSLLPTPVAVPGISYRYIRASALGQEDAKNVSARFREGWVPVNAKDHPELEMKGNGRGHVEIGGLILCKTSDQIVASRNNYYSDVAQQQNESVDNAYLRNNDPRMPLLKPERRSQVTFGSGNKPTDND